MELGTLPLSFVTDARCAIAAPIRAASQLAGRVTDLLATVLFWSAIVLPVCYLALLADGVATAGEFRLFVELFGLHVLALLGGRYHDRSRDRPLGWPWAVAGRQRIGVDSSRRPGRIRSARGRPPDARSTGR